MIVSSASPDAPDRLRVLALLRAQRRVQQQPRHADHAVHRRADLVAHRRQEGALRSRGRLRGVAGLRELGVASLERGVGLAKLLFQPLARRDVLEDDEDTDHSSLLIAIGHLDRVHPSFLAAFLVLLLDILYRPTGHHLAIVRMVGFGELAGTEGEGVLADDVLG